MWHFIFLNCHKVVDNTTSTSKQLPQSTATTKKMGTKKQLKSQKEPVPSTAEAKQQPQINQVIVSQPPRMTQVPSSIIEMESAPHLSTSKCASESTGKCRKLYPGFARVYSSLSRLYLTIEPKIYGKVSGRTADESSSAVGASSTASFPKQNDAAYPHSNCGEFCGKTYIGKGIHERGGTAESFNRINDPNAKYERLNQMANLSETEKIESFFEFLDSNRKGYIDKEDLRKLLLRMNVIANDKMLEIMIADVDVTGDNKITLPELKAFIMKNIAKMEA